MRHAFVLSLMVGSMYAVSCTDSQPADTGDAAVGGDAGTDAAQPGTDAGADVGVDAASGVAAAALVGRAFDIATNVDAGEPLCFGTCSPLILFVDTASESSLEVVLGFPGRALRASLVASGDEWVLGKSVLLEKWAPGWELCSRQTTLEKLALHFFLAGSGAVQLSGSGERKSTQCSEDTWEQVSVEGFTLTGSADSTPPTTGLAGVGGLAWLHSIPSEPLRATSSASIETGGGTLPFSPTLENGFVVGFSSDVILPFGTLVSATFSATDLAGNPLAPTSSATTPPDFGVFPQDGFESGALLGVSGDVSIVDGYGGVPAIAGQKMLHVPPARLTLLRLKRSGTESSVSARLRVLSECPYFAGRFDVSAGVVGGTQRPSISIQNPEMSPLGDAGTSEIGKEQIVTLPLSDAGTDVIVALWGEQHLGFTCAKVGALIDDVHLL